MPCNPDDPHTPLKLKYNQLAPPPGGLRRHRCDAGVDGVPLCQHADHALDTDSTVFPLKLWGIVTELRGCQRTQLAELIEWQLRIQ